MQIITTLRYCLTCENISKGKTVESIDKNCKDIEVAIHFWSRLHTSVSEYSNMPAQIPLEYSDPLNPLNAAYLFMSIRPSIEA